MLSLVEAIEEVKTQLNNKPRAKSSISPDALRPNAS
jgi:hypothetical protein